MRPTTPAQPFDGSPDREVLSLPRRVQAVDLTARTAALLALNTSDALVLPPGPTPGPSGRRPTATSNALDELLAGARMVGDEEGRRSMESRIALVDRIEEAPEALKRLGG
ncbi:hypothetical protein [Streptomyces sp. NPDC001381]|uniref:hypothetical protein n=1 Tax=Streptomyces sp. NPDC001381 TaxID=3364567 RepID=UPI0036A5E723